MIRIFKLVLLLVCSQVALGQAPSNYTNINGRYRWIAGMFDSTFHIPKGTTNSLRVGGSTNAGALFYNTTDSTVYTYTGTQWIKLRGVIIDTTSLSNRINLKLNISDTAAMLGNYLNNVGYGLSKAGQLVSADSATLANYFLRRKDSLTTTNLLGYVTRKILADTAAAIRSADAGGTVTSVATNNGTGITGGTITTSGTLAIDTVVISTRAWRQKGIDSVAALINSNVSGTANYLPKFTSANTIGNSVIYQSPALTNEIGIGTTAPGANLELYGSGVKQKWNDGSNSGIISIEGAPDNLFKIASPTSSIVFGTAATMIERMRITSTGQVGIGISSPDSLLTVAQGAHIQRGVRLSGLPTASGTKSLRIDANGTLSVSDTLTNGISGSGTTSYIPKFTSSSAIGNSIISESGGVITVNGGITMNGTMTIQSSGVVRGYFGDVDGDNNVQLRSQAALTFKTGGNNLRATLDSSGNLGLGVTPSAWGSNYTALQLIYGSLGKYSAEAVFLSANAHATADGAWKYTANGLAGLYYQTDGKHVWYNAASGTAGNAISFTQAMTLDASGNLIVGGTTANSRLHVVGSSLTNTFRVTDATNYTIVMGYEGSGNIGMMSTLGSTAKLALGTNSLARLTIDGTGNVGIGTTSPTVLFTIGKIGTANQLGFYDGATAKGFIGISAGTSDIIATDALNDMVIRPSSAGNMLFAIGSTERMRITSGGNVGIGTTSPTSLLHIASSGTPRLTIQDTDAGSGNVGITLRESTNDKWTVASVGGALTFFNEATLTNAIYVTSANNVGIGTTNPQAKLQVNGNLRLYTTDGDGNELRGIFNVGGAADPLSFTMYKGDATTIGTFITSDGNSYFNGGNVGIGTTNPTERFTVYGAVIRLEGAAGVSPFAIANNNSTGFRIYDYNAGVDRFLITSGGNVGIGTQTPNSTFDVAGSVGAAITTKSANYTLTSSDYTVGFDCASNRTATLPDATTCKGRIYVIYQYNTGTATRGVTIDPNGAQTINGVSTFDLTGYCDYTSVMIQSDGTNWIIISDALQSGCTAP